MSPIPPPDRSSFWERDEVLRRALRRSLGATELAAAEPLLARAGAAAADEVDRLASEADRVRPVLRTHDNRGERIDEVIYDASYRRMEDIAYRELRLVGLKRDPELRARGVAQRVGFAGAVLFGMGESGLLCPLCMTDGVARVLEQCGDAALRDEVVPRLCFGPGAPRATGAMFLTEKWGGSDVGENRTVARPDGGGRWRLTGEKFFCSNVDAELILALGRPEGAPEGTKGLGLFLLERALQPAGAFRIERLKDKLGTRSMPTGEVVLTDAVARQVGPVDRGWKQMAGMVNLSRLWNSAVSCSGIGRSWLEARAYLERRVAFGRPVAEQPLGREVLAELRAEYTGALELVLTAIGAMDAADAGDAEAGRLLRGITPLCKALTAKVAVACASEAIECLGGNGYVEDWPLARLFRDAQVLPVWEGTTNIQVLDLVRVAHKGELSAVFSRADAALEASGHAGLGEVRDVVRGRLALAREAFASMAAGGELSGGRRSAFGLGRALQAALLLEAADEEPDGPEADAARRLAARAGGPALACS